MLDGLWVRGGGVCLSDDREGGFRWGDIENGLTELRKQGFLGRMKIINSWFMVHGSRLISERD